MKDKSSSSVLLGKTFKMRAVKEIKCLPSQKHSKVYWNGVIKNIENEILNVSSENLLSSIYFNSFRGSSSVSNKNIKQNITDDNNKVSTSVQLNSCNKNTVNNSTCNVDQYRNDIKNKDKSNFKLDFKDDINTNVIKKVDIPMECEKLKINSEERRLNLNIKKLVKISKCINEFLSKSKISKNSINPIGLDNNKILNNKELNKKSILKDKIHEESVVNKLKVNLSITEENDKINDIEYCEEKSKRPRAPSLGIASTVPSFKNIVSSSSMEYSDSIDSLTLNENFIDLNLPVHLSKTVEHSVDKISLESNNIEMKPKSFLQVPKIKPTGVGFYPRLKQHNMELKWTFPGLYISKESQYSQKPQRWSKKSIFHVLKALKIMKYNKKNQIHNDNNSFIHMNKIIPSIENSSPIITDYHHLLNPTESNLKDNENDDEEESSDSSTSISSYSFQSVRRKCIKKTTSPSSIHHHDEKTVVSSSQFINNVNTNKPTLTLKSNTSNVPYYTTINSIGSSCPKLIKKKYKSELKEIKKINGMYQRKKDDKCIACLYSSMRNNPKTILDQLSMIYHHDKPSKKMIKNLSDIFLPNLYPNSSKIDTKLNYIIDEQKDLSCDKINQENVTTTTTTNVINNSGKSLSRLNSDKKVSISKKTTIDLDNKKSNSIMKSGQSLNQSVGSDYSKTISDQDDSDQCIHSDVGGDEEEEEDIVESRSKYLAACHAPLNLVPSFEPLKALRSKKARSIQSRMASLEKSTEVESNEESDEDEVMFGDKSKEENNKPCSIILNHHKINQNFIDNKNNNIFDYEENFFLQKSINQVESANFIEKFKSQDEYIKSFVSNNVPSKTVYSEFLKEFSLSQEIFTKLNLNNNNNHHLYYFNYSNEYLNIISKPIISDNEIINISLKLIQQNYHQIDVLKYLVSLYKKRLLDKETVDPNIIRLKKLMAHLLALLVDSKIYLNSNNNSNGNFEFSCKQKTSINSQKLRKILPVKSYNLIASVLGLPEWHSKHWTVIKDVNRLKISKKKENDKIEDYSPRNCVSSEHISTSEIDLIVHPPSPKKSLDFSTGLNEFKKKLNPYAAFLSKPKRKAVIWRPLTQEDLEGYDPDATLKRRAAKITDEICANFCHWLRNLGGNDTTVDEEVLKEMFEIDFSAEASRSIQVSIQQCPVVPTSVARAMNCPQAETLKMTKKLLTTDAKAEKKIIFGSNLPNELRFVPPKNETQAEWLDCKYVPHDLETMEAVWQGLDNLDSVKGFFQWMKDENPNLLRHLAPFSG